MGTMKENLKAAKEKNDRGVQKRLAKKRKKTPKRSVVSFVNYYLGMADLRKSVV